MTPKTVKIHLAASLFRGAFVNLSWIYASSLFVSTLGGSVYADVQAIASGLTICVYLILIYFSILKSLVVYVALFIGTTILSVGVLENQVHSFILMFSVGVLLIDFVGATLAGNLLQYSVPPAYFKAAYQKMISTELYTRLFSTALVAMLSWLNEIEYVLYTAWSFATVHLCILVFIPKTIERTKASFEKPTDLSEVSESKIVPFFRQNSLFKTIVFVTIWTYLAKFLCESIYFQAIELEFSSQTDIANFISRVSIFLIIGTLVFKKYFAEKLVDRYKPSTLLSVIPILVLTLVVAILVTSSFIPVVILYCLFMSINRSIQLPSLRHAMTHMPFSMRHKVVVSIFLLSSFASLIFSGSLAHFDEYVTLEGYLLLLVALTIPIFVPISQFDSQILRNMWSSIRERFEGDWEQNLLASPSVNLHQQFRHYFKVSDQGDWKSTPSSINLDYAIRKHIRSLYNRESPEKLAVATKLHKQLLDSKDAKEVQEGISLLYEIDTPQMRKSLESFLHHASGDLVTYALMRLRVLEFLDSLPERFKYRAHTIKKVKTILLRSHVFEINLETELKIRQLFKNSNMKLVAKFCDTVNFYVDDVEKLALLSNVIGETTLDLEPLLHELESGDEETVQWIKNFLLLLDSPDFISSSSKKWITLQLNTIKGSHSQIHPMLPHVLFIEELGLGHSKEVKASLDTIDHFTNATKDRLAILADVHLEILKNSPNIRLWKNIFESYI